MLEGNKCYGKIKKEKKIKITMVEGEGAILNSLNWV